MHIIRELNQGFTKLETGLSIAAMFPGVNFISAKVRNMFGTAQLIIGVAGGCFCYLASVCLTGQNKIDAEKKSLQAFHYAVHGASNIIKSFFEFIPLMGIAFVGWEFCFGKIHSYRDMTQGFNRGPVYQI